MTEQEKRENQKAMYGCTKAQLVEDANEQCCTVEMYCMSVLSDVQEMLSRGQTDAGGVTVNQYINRVKSLIGDMNAEKIAQQRAEFS